MTYPDLELETAGDDIKRAFILKRQINPLYLNDSRAKLRSHILNRLPSFFKSCLTVMALVSIEFTISAITKLNFFALEGSNSINEKLLDRE